jgi:chorismate lyase / 3-hydroxybenzoate synthase
MKRAGAEGLQVLNDQRVAHALAALGGAVVAGEHAQLRYWHNEDVLMGQVLLPEAAPSSTGSPAAIGPLAEMAYGQIFAALDRLDFGGLVRCWNYFPRINDAEEGLERYRHFNIGRQRAFERASRDQERRLPAACALGMDIPGSLCVDFVASRHAVRMVENPRQVSAYHYPPQYGPRSPSFSRAAVLALRGSVALFVSGTASIVGHQSAHVGDIVAQSSEVLRNLDAVCGEANRLAGASLFCAQRLLMNVYLRQADHRAQVQRVLQDAWGGELELVWLQADICRTDLLVEIEGFMLSDPTAARARRAD